MEEFLDAEEAAGAAARAALRRGGVTEISGRLGLRKAIEQTARALEHGSVILDATFEYENVSAQIHVLDWSSKPYRAISVTAATEITPRHLDDCALQAWTMRGLELPEHRFYVALTNADTVSDDRFDSRFEAIDVTEKITDRAERLNTIVADAREQHASLELPTAELGPRCRIDYDCPFLDYCERQ